MNKSFESGFAASNSLQNLHSETFLTEGTFKFGRVVTTFIENIHLGTFCKHITLILNDRKAIYPPLVFENRSEGG